MNVPLYIAQRYLLFKRKFKVINIITLVSALAITIGTIALVVVLSVFNGFENVVTSLFNSVNPDIQITATTKTFTPLTNNFNVIRNMEGVDFFIEVLEDNALVKYKDKQYIAKIKGVDENFQKAGQLSNSIKEGNYILQNGNRNFAIIGQGIAYNLDIRLNDVLSVLSIYAPKRTQGKYLDIDDAFNYENIPPAGIFSVQQEFDIKYIIVPIRFARKLFNYSNNEVSSVELILNQNADVELIKNNIKKILGNNFSVKNKYEQEELLFKIMKSEKWAVFLILTFILIVAVFNMIGTMTMMIIDKQKDIFILNSLGANTSVIKKIFFYEGLLVSITGTIAGLIIGYIICFLQMKYELVKINSGGTLVINAYPVDVHLIDFIYISITVVTIGILASWYPSRYITKKILPTSIN